MSTELSPVQKLQAELETAKASVATLTTERDTVKAELAKAAESAATLATEKAAIETAAAKAKADAEKAASDSAALLAAETAARVEIEKAQASTVAELDKAKRALANPAFVDAAMTGTQPVADAGTSGKSKEALYTEYKDLMAKDPKAATAFYRANKAAIESR